MRQSVLLCLLWLFSLAAAAVQTDGAARDGSATHRLTIEASPQQGGSFNYSSRDMAEGASLSLYAYPSSNFIFKCWMVDGVEVSTSRSYTYTMGQADATVTGVFVYDPANPADPEVPSVKHRVTLTAEPVQGGSFNYSSGSYAEGESLDLYAYANSNFRFSCWKVNGSEVSTSRSYTYTVGTEDADITGVFVYDPGNPGDPEVPRVKHNVVLTAEPQQGGSFNFTSMRVAEGDSITLYPYPNSNFVFKGWKRGGAVVSTDTYYGVRMGTSDVAVTGLFEYNPSNPSNPGSNSWNAETGALIVDDFSAGSLYDAVYSAIGGYSNLSKVTQIIVSGRMTDYDLSFASGLSSCSLIDLSRTYGYTSIPSWCMSGCAMNRVVLPSTVEKIGYRAFADCSNLTDLTIYAMEPPTLGSEVFDGVPEGLVIHVPAAAIPLYAEAEGWKDFTILPLADDTKSVEVTLPADAADGRYKNMTIELLNIDNGQKQRYIITDRTVYTFSSLLEDTRYSVTVKNTTGSALGRIDTVKVADEDVKVAFSSLLQPHDVALQVLTPDGTDITASVQAQWFTADGTYIQQGNSLTGQVEGTALKYSVTLPQEQGMLYTEPGSGTHTVASGSNTVTLTLSAIAQASVSGTVRDAETGQALSGAVVSVSQTLNGKYSKAFTAKTGSKGEYALTVFNAPSAVTLSADGYVSQTVEKADMSVAEIGEVKLSPITGVTITTDFTYTASVAEGETAETQSYYSDYANVSYALYNVTKGKSITQFSVQYPSIVLLEDADKGDRIRITASSLKSSFMPVTTEVTVGDDDKATATLPIVALGKLTATYVSTQNAAVVGLLYNDEGQLVNTYSYDEATFTTGGLADGRYSLVSMAGSDMFNTILNLSQYAAAGLTAGTDYVLSAVDVKSGVITEISNKEIPVLDESKFYYTGQNTSFTVNKTSIVAGNYLTLKGCLDFKSEYADRVTDVAMVIDLPASCTFVESSVMAGSKLASYTVDGQRVTIPLAQYTDEVRFCVIPTAGGDYTPNAFAEFTLAGKTLLQPIGNASYTVKDLTLSVPKTVAKTTVSVSGTAQANSAIRIYDGTALIGETTALANGQWKAEVSLNEPYNLSKHSISAQVTTKQGLELKSESKNCLYDKNAIEARTVTMTFYNGWLHKNVSVDFDFESGTTSTSSYMFYTGTDITFIADLTNNDTTMVSNVIINVFTDKGNVRELEASYNEKTDRWVAVGHFESNELPVNVSVDLTANNVVELDKELFDSVINSLENLQSDIDSTKKETEEIVDNIIEEYSKEDFDIDKIANLENELQSVIGFDLSSVKTPSNMTEDEIKAIIEKCDEVEKDSTFGFYANIMAGSMYDLKDAQKYLKGVTIKTCEGLTVEGLLKDGFKELHTTENTIYEYISDNNIYAFVDFEKNLYVIVDTSEGSSVEKLNAMFSAKKSSLGDAAIKYMEENSDKIGEIGSKIENVVNTITGIVSGIIETLDNANENIEKSLSDVKQSIKYLNETKSPLKNLFMGDLKTKYKSLIIARSVNDKIRKFINQFNTAGKFKSLHVDKAFGKAVALFDLVITVHEAELNAKSLINLYKSVPDPCEKDKSAADKIRTDIKWFSGEVTAYYLLQFGSGLTQLYSIGTGLAAAVPTAGTSLAAVGVAVGLGVANFIAAMVFDNTFKQRFNMFIDRINSLNCTGDPKDKPRLPYFEDGKNDDDIYDPNGSDNNGKDKKQPPFDPLSPIHDPSGYVYEAVSSNRLQGVTATCYYKETVEDMYGDKHDEVRLWNAEEYAQENPLFTDENGMYRWDVPKGLWQVKFEKDGYVTTQSEWLPVPPPQLDVNIAMTQNRQPEVIAAHAYTDGVEIEFDKYMLPETMTASNIIVTQDGEAVEGDVTLMNAETAYSGEDAEYASKVRFNAKKDFTAKEVTLTVSTKVKSYAGIRMQDTYTQTFSVEKQMRRVEADSAVNVGYGSQAVLTVSVAPAEASAGRTLLVKSSSSLIASVATETVTLDENGRAEVTVGGELPGAASVEYQVEGFDVTGRTIVNVVDPSALVTAAPVASVASGSSVAKGTGITLSCETEGAVIYYTLDGSCPCDDTAGRHVYDGTPIVIDTDTELKAMAVAEGRSESEVVTYTYTIDESGIAAVTAEWSVTPRVVIDRLYVEVTDGCADKVELFDASGKAVQTHRNVGSGRAVDVSGLPVGIYVVTVTDGGMQRNEKVVKCR